MEKMTKEESKKQERKGQNVLIYISLVIGFIAPTFELITRICGGIFFNPLPGWFSITLFYMTPAALLVSFILLRKEKAGKNILNKKSNRTLINVLLTLSMIVSMAYSVWFLPISWISVIGTIAFGMGILGLAPFFLLTTSLILFSRYKKAVSEIEPKKYPVLWRLLAGIPLLVIFTWTPIIVGIASLTSSTDHPAWSNFMLSVVKTTANKEQFREKCFDSYTLYDEYSLLSKAQDEDTKKMYYYIYGENPSIPTEQSGVVGSFWEWEWDDNLGGDVVGNFVKDLYLDESSVDISASLEGNNVYYEWTMIFENENDWSDKEARAVIQLPPNATVSKLSLWIDGEEEPAAFGLRSDVKSAYKSVVYQTRDPVLVNMIGQDLIMAQCYPVPAQGTMKIRIGITSPLLDGTIAQVPYIAEANFEIPEELKHSLWIEADTAFTARYPDSTVDEAGSEQLVRIYNDILSDAGFYFMFEETENTDYSYDGLTLSAVNSTNDTIPAILVIDGTKDIISQLKNIDFDEASYRSVYIAHPYGYSEWDGESEIEKFIRKQKTFGGADAMPALSAALEDTISSDASVLWIHGRILDETAESLALEQFGRRLDDVRIVTVQASPGLNMLLADITLMPYFYRVPTLGDLPSDIERGLDIATQPIPETDDIIYLGGAYESGLAYSGDSLNMNSHPYRLYLYSRIMKQWYEDGSVDDDLIMQSIESRIVSPVVGAVVLASQSDYDDAGLDPTKGSDDIPTIPEPEFYLLIGLVIMGTGAALFYRKKKVTHTV